MNEIKSKAEALMAEAEVLSNKEDYTPADDEQFKAKIKEAKDLYAKQARNEEMAQFKAWEKQSAGRISNPAESFDLPKQTKKHRYNLLKAIDDVLETGQVRGFEREVSDEIALKMGKTPTGFYMPKNLNNIEKFTGVLNETTGTGAIGTITPVNTYIELLRNRLVVQAAGARIMTGLSQNFSIPQQTGGGTAAWVAESGAPSASNQTVGSVLMQPTTLAAYTDVSRRFIKQSSFDAESFVIEDLAKVSAIAIDLAALNGTGSSNQPLGILQNGSITTNALGTNGAAPTFGNMVDMESTVSTANADLGKLGYVMSAHARGFFKKTPKVSQYPQFIMEDGEINDYPVYVTNNMPDNLTKGSASGICSGLIFGNFDDLMLGFWGEQACDLLVDPYTGSNSGTVRVVALTDCTVKVRHTASFVIVVDALCA